MKIVFLIHINKYSIIHINKYSIIHINKYSNLHFFPVLAKNENDMIEVQRALATLGRTHFCHAEALTTNNKTLYDQALMDSKKSYQESLDTCKM